MQLVFKIRDIGIALSDRRAVKVLRLVAASALLCGRQQATPTDLWVLRYVWDREEQIEALSALVNGALEQHGDEPNSHPLSTVHRQPDAEELARELAGLENEMKDGPLSLAAVARLRERLADVADRAAWIKHDASRSHLLERARACSDRLR